MTAYLDTSLIVSVIAAETTTAAAQTWIVNQADASLSISGWVVTEVSAALALKIRTRAITVDQRATALALFRRLIRDRMTVVPIADTAFREAARFADDPATALKAGDALHLAIADQFGATLFAFDRQQAAAGPVVGVPTRLVA